MEAKWYCPQKGKENRSKDWQTECKVCCSVCKNKCNNPPCLSLEGQLCAWRRTLTEMMMERIIPDGMVKNASNAFGQSPHDFYYQLRQYEWFKKKGHKSRDKVAPRDEAWEAQFMKKFEKRWGKRCIQ